MIKIIVKRKGILYIYFRAFILILVIPILSINLLFNKIYRKILLENSTNRIMQTIGQVALSVQNDIKRISLAASTISNDDEIMELVSQWNRANDSGLKFEIYKQINSKLNYFFNYTNEVDSIIFFCKDKGMYNFKNYPIMEYDDIRKMNWYSDTLKNKGRVTVLGSHQSLTANNAGKDTFVATIKPGIPDIRSDVELIYFSFKTNIFNNFYNSFFSENIGDMIIVDESNKIMIAKDNNLLGKDIEGLGIAKIKDLNKSNYFIEELNGKKYVITTQPINETNWKILNVVEYKTITKDVDRISIYSLISLAVFAILFLGFSLLFFKDIVTPINKLISKMHKVEKGNFDANIDISGNYEIYSLGNTFNKMISEIKQLIIQRDNKEKERNKAEIEALQSQINPHFISNTLNSIRLMAMIANMESISTMTGALIKLLQAAFGKTGKVIKVKEEVENLREYVYIMKVRYGEKFDVKFQIEDAILDKYILRLILQPIIENAILHGVNELEEKGIIEVVGYLSEKCLMFEIADNGIGMTVEQIDRIFIEDCSNSKGFTGIGIMNVDKRIKLNYGKNYGISIESIPGEFTKVMIKLPVSVDEIGG